MLETLREDYILSAKAKGLPEKMIRDKHAARNALLPVWTGLVFAIGGSLSGGIITETIFSWPGIGLTLLQAATVEDIPLAMGALTVTGVLTLIRVLEPLWRIRLKLFARGFKKNWALFAESPVGLIGLGVIIFFGLIALAQPILINTVWEPKVYDPINGFDIEIPYHPSPPSARHLMGTDVLGRDVLSQLMYSSRFEFALGLISAIVTVLIATTIGAVSAYFGGLVDTLLMRLVDLVIMVPYLAILIVLSALMEVGMIELALFIGLLSGFGGTSIVIKSQALSVKVKPFIEAARVAGGGHAHIIFTHLVPNLMPISLLYMMFVVTGAIFSEAVLSFFGLTEIQMSWGLMINTTQVFGYLLRFDTWWLLFPASLSITFLCAAFYMVGRALDEVVNPRLRER
jgi:peptide/nickel transport system permease protein